MVMLNQDAESLLAVLTARNLDPRLYITAAALEEDLKQKMIKAGANVVLAPYEVASQFLNSATLRPAVNDFFNSILFDQETNHQITQLELGDDSPWIGKRIDDLGLREKFDAVVIGIRLENGGFLYAPGGRRVLGEYEILLGVAPGPAIPVLQGLSRPGSRTDSRFMTYQRLAQPRPSKSLDKIMSLPECIATIEGMSKHFVICGDDHIIQSAVSFFGSCTPLCFAHQR